MSSTGRRVAVTGIVVLGKYSTWQKHSIKAYHKGVCCSFQRPQGALASSGTAPQPAMHIMCRCATPAAAP